METLVEPIAQQQFLTFLIAGEEYGIGILRVKEIIEYEPLTRVPTMPKCIRGVINLRGSVVPVIDLSVKFGLGESAVTRFTCIIIVEVDLDGTPTLMGLMSDSVSQVVELTPEEIEPAPAFGTRIRVDHLLGMGKIDKKFIMIFDVDRVLSIDELLAACSAQPPAESEKPAEVA
jgi:purine-binding chemotaxis protein CheW